MNPNISSDWSKILGSEKSQPYFSELLDFVNGEYSQYNCFPHSDNIFRAFKMTDFDKLKVVILGQDPYHTPGAAMGLSFSIPNGTKIQPSLRNIFKELESDLGIMKETTDLSHWATQGVLLLNAVLTVRSGEAGSHANRGWETFTDNVIHSISTNTEHIVFVLWGNYAASKIPLIDASKHLIITSAHPSPFSAHRGFLGSKPFSKINTYLSEYNKDPIDWN